VLVCHYSAIGENQTVAVDAFTLSLAKLAGHLGESMHAVVVARSTEGGETTEKSQRRGVRK
jgi:hypothetical protein